ncbi:hypothetical protein D9M73_277010 [compost metagenome]
MLVTRPSRLVTSPCRVVTSPSTLVTRPSRLLILVVLVATCSLVSWSCEPFTASVLVADSSPAARLVMVVEVPPGFRVTLL